MCNIINNAEGVGTRSVQVNPSESLSKKAVADVKDVEDFDSEMMSSSSEVQNRQNAATGDSKAAENKPTTQADILAFANGIAITGMRYNMIEPEKEY